MSSSLPGNRELPESRYDLSTYWGRVRQTLAITDTRYVANVSGVIYSCLVYV